MIDGLGVHKSWNWSSIDCLKSIKEAKSEGDKGRGQISVWQWHAVRGGCFNSFSYFMNFISFYVKHFVFWTGMKSATQINECTFL